MATFKALTNAANGGFRQAAADDQMIGEASIMNVLPAGGEQPRWLRDIVGGFLPSWSFGITANARIVNGALSGGSDQTDNINRWLQACHDRGVRPYLPRREGYGYLVLGTVAILDEGDYDGLIMAPNSSASPPVLSIVPDPNDLTDIPLSEIKTWTNCVDGASQIGGLDASYVGQFITVDTGISTRTGSIASGSSTLTIDAATTLRAGLYVTVVGAGDDGAPLRAPVTAITNSGRTLTLGRPAGTTVSGAAVTYSDQTVCRRASSGSPSPDIRLRDAFYVNDSLGHITSPLIATWDLAAWSAASGRAQRVRNRLSIKPPPVILYGPANGQRERVIDIRRCNLDVSGIDIRNASNAPFHQGVVVEGACWVRLDAPAIDGLNRVSTNYGISFGLAVGCTVDFGAGTLCRRSLDSHLGKDLTINGGYFPDGVGSHYVTRIRFNGSVIGVSNGDNAYCAHFSGRDFRFSGCVFSLCGPGRSVFRVRSDIMKVGGSVVIDGGSIIEIDTDTLPAGIDPTLIDIMGPNVTYDTEITTEMPTNIVVDETVTVKMRGIAATRNLYLLRYLKALGTGMPQTITGTQNILLAPTVQFDNPSFTGTSGHPRCRIIYTNAAQLADAGTTIRIRNVPDLYVVAVPDGPGSAGKKTGRATFDVDLPTASAVEMDMQGGGYVTATVQSPNVTWVERDTTRHGDESEIQIDPRTGERTNATRRVSATPGSTIPMRQDKRLQIITDNNLSVNGLTIKLPPPLGRDQRAIITTDSVILNVVFDGNGASIVGTVPTQLAKYSRAEFVLLPDALNVPVWKYLTSA